MMLSEDEDFLPFYATIFMEIGTIFPFSMFFVWYPSNQIIPSKMEVSTAMMSYDFKMSSDYNHDVLKL